MPVAEKEQESPEDFMRKRIPILCKMGKFPQITEDNAATLIPTLKDCKDLYLLQVRIYAARLGWITI